MATLNVLTSDTVGQFRATCSIRVDNLATAISFETTPALLAINSVLTLNHFQTVTVFCLGTTGTGVQGRMILMHVGDAQDFGNG